MAHTSKITQQLLTEFLGAERSWSKEMWLPSSPDTNLLDFSFCWVLAAKMCEKSSKNREDLILRSRTLAQDSPPYVIDTCAAAWHRLQRIVNVDGK